MADYIIGLILGFIAGLLLGVLLTSNAANWKDKMACEENLPRNVDCIWGPP